MISLPLVATLALSSVLVSTRRNLFKIAAASAFAALALLPIDSIHAQASRAGLISQAVTNSQRVVLPGNVHPQATRANDRGIVPASMPADRMLLILRRSPDQELALRAQIQSMNDKNSPNFHKWLTPQQFGAQWGAVDSDIAAVTAWLQSQGFTVKGPSAGRTAIEFSGTAGQIQSAFHTEIHSYMVDGVLHHANASNPQIPAALAPVVAGIASLNDFHPKSMAKKGKLAIYDAKTHRVRQAPNPNLTGSDSNGNDLLYLGPADAATIYNSPIPYLNAAATGRTFDGTGAKIGIIGDSNISTKQAANYRTLFGLAPHDPSGKPKVPTVIVDGGTDPGENGDALEAYLDIEVANGIAPGATVYFYTAADSHLNSGLDLAILRAVNDNLADVLNLSFGACEAAFGQAVNQYYEGIWEQAAAQGQSVTVSTGDSGSAACDDSTTVTVASDGLQVNGLASTPFNIAVGGTDFTALLGPDGSGTDFTNYVSLNSDATTLGSAKGYIPETPWNDTFANFPAGPISVTQTEPAPYDNIVAAGGGKSSCVAAHLDGNNLICEYGYSKPSWQSAVTPKDGARDIPDVSMFAGNGVYAAAWGICTDSDTDSAGNPIEDCVPGSNGLAPNEFYLSGVGGTSASAPAFAGVLALVRQATGERQGLANYVLYNLATNAPGVFNDVTTGNNSVPCAAGTLDCKKNTAGYDYLTGYDAGTGYDLASGLGSVNISKLITNWSSAGLTATATTLSVTPTSFQHGTVAHVDATVTSTGGIPSGDVAITASANSSTGLLAKSIGIFPLDAAGTTGDLALNSLPGGSYKLTASYGGSENFALSVSAPVALNITPEPSTVFVSTSAYNPVTGAIPPGATLHYGDYIGYDAQPYGNNSPIVGGVVEPDGIPTGNVRFSAGGLSLGTAPLGSTGVAESIGYNLPAGSYTLSAAYSGDNSFNPSIGTIPLVIAKAPTKLSLSASATKYSGTPIVFTVHLTSESAADAPTGTVAIVADGVTIATGPLVGASFTSSAWASGTASISTSNLPPTQSQITAVYLGDVNYARSTSNAVVVSGKPTFRMTNVSLTLTGEHTTGATDIPVISEGGYAGTIKFTCALSSTTTATAPPLCLITPSSEELTANGTIHPQILVFGKGTKIPKGLDANNTHPTGMGVGLGIGAGTAALACCFFFGIPARRRKWKSMLTVLLLLAGLSSFSACSSQAKFVSAGKYTFTVRGTDTKDSTNTHTSTVQVDVL